MFGVYRDFSDVLECPIFKSDIFLPSFVLNHENFFTDT